MDKINKLSLPATIIISSLILGGFYYASQINKQKSIAKQQQIKIEQEMQNRLAEELKEQQTKEEAERVKGETERTLNICIADAEKSYSNNWRNECKSQGLLTSRCISLNEMTFDEYVKQNNIPQDKRFDAITDFYNEKDECSCRLPLENADRIEESSRINKDECFKKYPRK